MTDQPTVNDPLIIDVSARSNGHSEKPLDLPQLQAYEVTLSNGYKLWVHEAAFEDLPTYFRALPALIELANMFAGYDGATGLVNGLRPTIPPEVIEGITPLFAIMTDIPIEKFKRLRIEDGLAVLLAMGEFAPKNSSAAPES